MDPFSLSEHCSKLAHPDTFTVLLASVIVVGILISYLPQHAKIIQNRTSEGLSPWWVLLGGLSSIAAIGNILTLPASREDVRCCKEISGNSCAAALLGIAQIGLQWGCFMFIVMLYLIYFPAPSPLTHSTASLSSTSGSNKPTRRDAIIVGSTTLASLLLVGITSIALVAAWPHHTQNWANFLGSVAGALATIQYVPQIWYTYRLGDVKSLSIVTMIIQVPGAFLFAFSLWQRVGWEGWSTWLMFVITGFLQGILLGLAISYYLAKRGRDKEEEESVRDIDDVDGTEEEVDERTPLVGNGYASRKSGSRPIVGTQRSAASARQLGLLYAATPPDQDSDRSSSGRGEGT